MPSARRATTPAAASSGAPLFAWTPKRERFCVEYMVDLCGAEATRRAGYSAKSARSIARELMAMPEIQARIAALQAERSVRTEITVDWVLTNAREVVDRCMQRAPVMVRRGKEMVQLQDDDGRDVWQFDSVGAMKGLTLISKHTGGFNDRVEHTGPEGGPQEVRVTHVVVDPSAG